MRCLAFFAFPALAVFATAALAQQPPGPRGDPRSFDGVRNETTAPDAAAGDTFGGIGGEWSGTYVCAQGLTALRLIARQTSGTKARVLFYFFPEVENPGVPDGCFAMSATYNAATRSWDLRAENWLKQPRDYLTIDLTGAVDPTGRTFAGAVVGNPSCTRFNLLRGATSRPLPRECNVLP
jgi:hypothetical protein